MLDQRQSQIIGGQGLKAAQPKNPSHTDHCNSGSHFFAGAATDAGKRIRNSMLSCRRMAGLLLIFIVSALTVAASPVPVVINEFVASNSSTLAGDDEEYPDWIELHNSGDELVNLAGYGLSDNPGVPFKWVFPDVDILPSGYLVVLASGQYRSEPQPEDTHLHVSFAISSRGEPLLLTAPDGELVDSVEPVQLLNNVSYGRGADGGWYYFQEPTPGAPNDTKPYKSILAPPSFSHEAGFHEEAIWLTLEAEEGALLLYTLDGSEPHPDNIGGGPEYLVNYFFPGESTEPVNVPRRNQTYVYDGPIEIVDRSDDPNDLAEIITTYGEAPLYWWSKPARPVHKGTVVRARSWTSSDDIPSPTRTATYFVGQNPGDWMGLPIVSIAVDVERLLGFERGIYIPGRNFFDQGGSEVNYVRNANHYYQTGWDWEAPANKEFFESNMKQGYSQGVGLRIHGGGSRRNPLKSLRVYSRSRYGDNAINYDLFPGWPRRLEDERPPEFRRLLLHAGGHVADQLRDPVAHAVMSPAKVGIQRVRFANKYVNGEYWGVIQIRDRIDGHYIAEQYNVDAENVIMVNAPRGPGQPSDVEVGRPDEIQLYQPVYEYAVTNDLSNAVHFQAMEDMLDLESYMDYHIVFIHLMNTGWYGRKHFRFWRVRETSDAPYQDGKWRVIVWDFDSAVRSEYVAFDLLANAIDPNGSGVAFEFMNNPQRTAILRSLLENDQFRHRFVNRFCDHMNSSFQAQRIIDIAEGMHAALAPTMDEHTARWGEPPTRFRSRTVNDWITYGLDRSAHVRDHLRHHFAVGEDRVLTLDRTGSGRVRVNTLLVDEHTPGLADPSAPYPWTGIYFENVPVVLEAIPDEGQRFAGWRFAGSDGPTGQSSEEPWFSTEPKISVMLANSFALEAVFEPLPPLATIHRWDFTDEESLLQPSISSGQATLTIDPGPETEWLRNDVAQGFESPHLRVNAPLGAALTFAIPTTGFESVLLEYSTRRSGQGAGHQTVWYTLDGADWEELASYRVEDEAPQLKRFDLSALPPAQDNALLGIRITFAIGNGGTAGNNRFDDIRIAGLPLAGVEVPPQVIQPIQLLEFTESSGVYELDLNNVFIDLNGDNLEFDATVSRPDAALASVTNGRLSLHPLHRGETAVTISADDGHFPPVPHTFRLIVHPEAHAIRGETFRFGEWRSNEREHNYPENMLFLQSAVSDPGVHTPLDHAYYIPPDDYAASDSAGFPYNNSSRTRINGLGSEGISFINTGRGRDVGGALLALDTRGIDGARVSWLAGTRVPNSRIYALRLQYRVGINEPFQDLLNADGFPLVYTRNPTSGHTEAFGPVPLPSDALEQPYVQLLWRYHHVEGNSGPRPELRLDQIEVNAAAIHPYDAWRKQNFNAEELEDPQISGPDADPDLNGIPNLLRCAFGLNRNDSFSKAMPNVETAGPSGSESLIYRYRRLPDPTNGIRYILQVNEGNLYPGTWRDAEAGEDYVQWNEPTPAADGVTEEITLQILGTSSDTARFFRLRVELFW
jgi:hypothetical protein